jgi:hypothetical protein
MFLLTYTTVATVWAELIDKSGSAAYIMALRGVDADPSQVYDTIFRVRYVAIKNLGRAFNTAFSDAVDAIEDIDPIKSDYTLFLQVGNNPDRGRRYKVFGSIRDDDHKDYVKIFAKQLEESGTGAQL